MLSPRSLGEARNQVGILRGGEVQSKTFAKYKIPSISLLSPFPHLAMRQFLIHVKPT